MSTSQEKKPGLKEGTFEEAAHFYNQQSLDEFRQEQAEKFNYFEERGLCWRCGNKVGSHKGDICFE